MRLRLALCLVLATGPGCYLSHQLHDDGATPRDAGADAPDLPPVDAGPLPDFGPRPLLTLDCGAADRYAIVGRTTAVAPASVEDDDPMPDFVWDAPAPAFPEGSRTVLTSSGETAALTPDVVGEYALRLVVQDHFGNSRVCWFDVHAIAGAPAAYCFPHVTTTQPGMPAHVEGAGYDDGRIVSYAWSVADAPDGGSGTFAPADERASDFVPDTRGQYTVFLTVTDDSGETGSCFSYVFVQSGPVANCSISYIGVAVGTPALLYATADESGEPLTYEWTVTNAPDGSRAAVVRTTDNWSFTPDVPGGYLVAFRVTDGEGRTDACVMEIQASVGS